MANEIGAMLFVPQPVHWRSRGVLASTTAERAVPCTRATYLREQETAAAQRRQPNSSPYIFGHAAVASALLLRINLRRRRKILRSLGTLSYGVARGSRTNLTRCTAAVRELTTVSDPRQLEDDGNDGDAVSEVDVAGDLARASRGAGSKAAKPWLQRHLPGSKSPRCGDELLLCFLEALEERGVTLYRAQEEAVLEIFRGHHVVLDTPTGSGKSLVAVAMFFKALGEGKRAYYTSPTKALVSEKFFDLCALFGPSCVGMATGDVSINSRARIVCCTTEVLTSIALRDGPSARVDYVAMDEFHYYGDKSRGAAWEIPLWRMPQAAFLLMSGTLGANPMLYKAIEQHSNRKLRVVSSTERPVPLHFSYSQRTVGSTVTQLVQNGKAPVYAVHFSHAEALATASALAQDPALQSLPEKLSALRGYVDKEDFASPFGPQLKSLLLCGVGVHHAGLLPRYRRLVERLAQAGLLQLVCGTDTLGVGINVPIRSVVFTRLCKFDGDGTDILQSRDFHQIAGRAGRKGFDDEGYVVALAPDWEVYNKELRSRIESGERLLPRWKRPPRRNYKHWTGSTFDMLQHRSPAPLRSQFRLSMSQVLNLMEGARRRGADGMTELNQLIDCAQCSRGQKRHMRRQVDTFLRALRDMQLVSDGSGNDIGTVALQQELPTQGQVYGSDGVDNSSPSTGSSMTSVATSSSNRGATPPDDASLYLMEVLPRLEEEFCDEDLPLAVLGAVEAVCEAPSSIFRRRQPAPKDGNRFVTREEVEADIPREGDSETPEDDDVELIEFNNCPEALRNCLYEGHARFVQNQPWIRSLVFQPKSLALNMLRYSLSFAELVKKLESSRKGVVAEGALLRYLLDVYRTLRYSIPDEYRSAAVTKAEAFLRSVVQAIDSSLLQEWEALKSLETQEASGAAEVGEAVAAAAHVSAEASGKSEAAMVPQGDKAARRTKQELQQRVLVLREELDARWLRLEAEEEARNRSIMGKLRRVSSWVLRVGSKAIDSAIGTFW